MLHSLKPLETHESHPEWTRFYRPATETIGILSMNPMVMPPSSSIEEVMERSSSMLLNRWRYGSSWKIGPGFNSTPCAHNYHGD